MVGIKETKEVLVFGLNFQKGIVASNADGTINWMDIGNLMPVVQSAGAAINGIGKIKAELLDIDDAEQAELVEITKGFYENLSSVDAKVLISDIVNWVIDGVQLAIVVAALNSEPTEEEIS
jgi:hypothetical protein